MQTISAALTAHYAQATTSIATYFHVVRADGQVFTWTSHDQDQVIDGRTFTSALGLKSTAVHRTDDMRVNTLDVTVFLQQSTEQQIAAGIWDDATVTLFEANWRSLPAVLFDTDCLILLHGRLGTIQRQDHTLVAELRGLTHVLNNRVGRQYSYTCPWRHARWNGSTYVPDVQCGVNLATHIHDGAVTLVEDNTISFRDTVNTLPDGYYVGGLLTWTTGSNAGLTVEIAGHASNGFVLGRRVPAAIQVGDIFKAVRGDNRTPDTCKTVYNNYLNFGGFPNIPGQDAVFGIPQVV